MIQSLYLILIRFVPFLLDHLLSQLNQQTTIYAQMYVANKEKIIAKEHELLRVLSFDVELDLPHKYLLNIAR